MSEQRENLARVCEKIAPMVAAWCELHLKFHPSTFHMEELVKYVSRQIKIAPDSPSRILRDMRRSGVVNYRVLNRKKSLYEVLPNQKGTQ